jgi:hypothetical protein
MLLVIAAVFAGAAALLYLAYSNAATVIGSSPEQAITMAPGTNSGVLQPGERRWFRIMPNFQSGRYRDMSLSMLFAAQDLSGAHSVNFQLFADSEVDAWRRGAKPEPINFGAGMPVGHDGAPNVSERIWRGSILGDGSYYLTLDNGSAESVNYWLADGESPVTMPADESVAPTQEVPLQAKPDGVSPAQSLLLADEQQHGKLQPGQEVWYQVVAEDRMPDQFEPMALTLVTTPNDIFPIANVALDIFTRDAIQAWSPENRTGIANMGAGSLATRDDNPLTGEKSWSGWVINWETYYVRIVNYTAGPIDYWLFKGDVYYPQLQ